VSQLSSHASLERPILTIFISHSNPDRFVVKDIKAQLQQRGFRPCLCEIDKSLGRDAGDEVKMAIRSSDIVLICLSKYAFSKAGEVDEQIKLALDVIHELPEGTSFVVSARLDECDLPEGLPKSGSFDLHKPWGFENMLSAMRLAIRIPNNEGLIDYASQLVALQ